MKVTYKGETRNIPAQYLKGLKGKDREKQIASIFKGTIRPKTKAPEKRSQWVKKFEDKYGVKITNKSYINKNIITNTGIKKIMDKGKGAYFTGGSRPNQTPESWAYSRLASVIMNGPARKVDKDIWEKYKRK
jgi:hypothetical protein